jgi:hypothetical protein
MARHDVAAPGTVPAGPSQHRERSRRLLVTGLAVVLLVTGGLLSTWSHLPAPVRQAFGGTDGPPPCTPTVVRVVVAPAIAPTVRRVLSDGTGTPAVGCARVDVSAQSATAVVAGSATLAVDRVPELWIPDSSSWLDRVPQWQLEKLGSMGLSPVVLASSRQVIDRLGWRAAPPTWAQALTSGQPMAVPNPLAHTESLAAIASAWVSLGRGQKAREAIAAVRLETGRVAGLGPEAGLSLGQTGTELAPLVPVTEQQVIAANRARRGSTLAAVYPADGSPLIDYPVLRVRPGSADLAAPKQQEQAVTDVAVRLTSSQALSAATDDGFRVTADTGIPAAGVTPGPVRSLPPPTPSDLAQVDSMLRMLALVDASLSMSAGVEGGMSRIDLATLAAKRGADLMPDSSAVGLWGFARRIYGRSTDWIPISPIAQLGAQEKGRTHRENLLRLDISQFGGLQGGGTALYDSVAAAVRAVNDGWRPDMDNSIVVFTDGANDKSGGLDLPQLVSLLKAQQTGGRPIAVYGIGIGPDVDMKALREIAAAGGGKAYQVNSAAEIREALIDGVSYRATQNLLRGGAEGG